MSPPTCQKCGGDIAGWLCQNCPAEFRENDDGVLIFDVEAPAEAGDTLHPDAQPFEQYPELALHIERMAISGVVGSMISWDAFLRELNAALRAQPQARSWGWDYEICTGCSASLTMADIKASGKVSCCPDRRMVTVRELVDAYDARRVAEGAK